MVTIRFRLIALFVLLVTLALTGFGVYGQFRLSQELEQRFGDRQKEAVLRLQTSLPSALWNFDQSQAERIIQAELEAVEVSSVTVFDSRPKVFVAMTGKPRAGATPSKESDLVSVEANLFVDPDLDKSRQKGEPAAVMGRVAVTFSRGYINDALRAALVSRLVEIFLLDGLLIVVLTVSLNMVFRPIAQLRDALFDLAEQEGEDAKELPETTHNEFGEVIRAFNQTQRKLRQVIARRTQAEEAARVAAAKTDEAYRDLQSAQDSLVQSEKLAGLGSLVAGVAHEINTPIGVVLTGATLLGAATARTQGALTDGSLRKSDITAYMATASESTRLITSNAERAAHLIQSFKQVAVDQTSDQRRTFKLNDYLIEVTTSLQPSLRKARATAEVKCSDDIQMDSYPGLLAQVLTNLTMNAIVHAFEEKEGGQIMVIATSDGHVATIAFSDNGCGIPAENIGKVFDPFFTTRRGHGGTGLGLNIVFNIVTKQLGGTITVQNVVDGGARFTICIPLVTPDTAID